MADRRILLTEQDIPTHWYNLAADLATPPPPPLHPGTGQPVGPDDLAPLFPMALILQEVVDRSLHPDPGSGARRVCDVAADAAASARSAWSRRSARLPHLLQVRGRLAGRLAQAEHGRAAGLLQPRGGRPPPRDGDRRRAVGRALSFAGALFGLEVKVYMVRASYDAKPYRRSMIETWGASVVRARRRTRTPGAASSPRARTPAARWASRSRRPSRTPRRATTRSTRSAPCSTTCCCTRP